jgi:hypothetical protein
LFTSSLHLSSLRIRKPRQQLDDTYLDQTNHRHRLAQRVPLTGHDLGSYKKKSEVAHHRSETTSVDVTTTFQGLLALLTTLGRFQATEKLLETIDVKIIVGGRLGR